MVSTNVIRTLTLTASLAVIVLFGLSTTDRNLGSISALRQQQRRMLWGSGRIDLSGPSIVVDPNAMNPLKPGYTQDGRPIMYTFYQSLKWGGTGMTADADTEMLRLWADSWKLLGWQPIVLNLEDAKAHIDYDKYWKDLQKVPVKQYDQFCYLRWLAVANAGGGWMSDYDVIPIRNFNHNIGQQITVYDHVGRKGMPFLVSGSEAEWNKLAMVLLKGGLNHREEKLWSDMFALMNDAQGMYKLGPRLVISCQFLLTGKPWSDEECILTNQYDAIHFCHECLIQSSGSLIISNRPRIARDLIQHIRNECDGPALRRRDRI